MASAFKKSLALLFALAVLLLAGERAGMAASYEEAIQKFLADAYSDTEEGI